MTSTARVRGWCSPLEARRAHCAARPVDEGPPPRWVDGLATVDTSPAGWAGSSKVRVTRYESGAMGCWAGAASECQRKEPWLEGVESERHGGRPVARAA